MRKLYSFYWDCGRAGHIEGVFVATEEEVHALVGKRLFFGEVLGKHSDITGILEEGDITVKSDDQTFIDKLVEVFGSVSISGFYPFNYANED